MVYLSKNHANLAKTAITSWIWALGMEIRTAI